MAIKNLGKVVGEDGRGIVSVEKTNTEGLVDTYTITYTDNTTSTFNITNGKDGENGSGEGESGSCLLTEQTITIGETGDVPVTGIELDYSTMSINVGESFQLAATVLPENASNNVVTWKSSDSSIATCVEGYVTGIKGGKVTIIASSLENSSITATCTVNIIEASDDGRIYFANLTPVKDNTMINKDGKTEFASNTNAYYQLPYTEGMQISTAVNKSHSGNYPPIVVNDDGKVTTYLGTETVIAGQLCQYVNTLSGHSSQAVVYVNSLKGYEDNKYYIEGSTPEEPEQPDEPTEPDTPVEPDVPDVPTGAKVYFSDLTPVNVNVLLKNDGVTEYSSNGYQYYQIPYSEGMQISTYYNRTFSGGYSPFIIKDGSTMKAIIGDETVVAGALSQYTTTLTGYSTEAIVYVNTRADGDGNLKYYIEGGNN